MKNILYLHTGAELYGADIILLTLLGNINRKKYNPIVVLPTNGPLVEKIREIGVQVEVIDYPILRRQYFTPKGISDYVRTYLGACKKITAFAMENDISIIHVNTIAVLEGIYVSRKIAVPLLWHVHEILEHPKIVYYMTSALLGAFSKKVIAVSEAVKNHLKHSKLIRRDKIQVIYNGVNNNIFKPDNDTTYLKHEMKIPEDSFVIGMIGRVNAIKGQEDFLKIVCPLIKKYDNVYAVMVGGVFQGQEWRMEALKQRVQESGVSEKIRLLDYRMDAPNLHCLFDVYVLPSVQADSLPTVVLEAMASKRVVVGYKNGGIVEMVQDRKTGYLEEIGEAEALSEDIEQLILSKDLYAKMAQAGFDRQKGLFSISQFIECFEEVYKSCDLM